MAKQSALLCTAALLVGGTAGFYLGGARDTAVSAGEDALRHSSHTAPAALTASGTPAVDGGKKTEAESSEPGGPLNAEELLNITQEMSMFSGFRMANMRKMVALQERLLTQDIRPLLDALASQTSAKADMAWHVAIGAYAEQDPRAALEYALSTAQDLQRTFALYPAVSAAAEMDPDAALRRLRQIENPLIKRQALSAAYQAIAQKDPAKAFEYLNTDGNSSDGGAGLGIIYTWARRDPNAAAAAIENVRNEAKRAEYTAILAQHWATSDPDAAWAWVQKAPVPAETYRDPRLSIISSLSHRDPLRAIEMANTLPEGELRRNAFATAVSTWTDMAPEDALEWATNVSDNTTRAHVLLSIAQRSSIDPARVFNALLEHMPQGDRFDQGMRNVIGNWSQKDPAAAAKALTTLPGNLTNYGLLNVATHWVQEDPAAAFQWITELPEGNAKASALEGYFAEKARRDPQAAQSDLQRLSEKDKQSAIVSLARGWAGQAPTAAAQWISTVTDQEARRRGIESVAREWASSTPAQAAAWAARLPEADRSGALATVVSHWVRSDVESASAWLNHVPAGPSRDPAVEALSRAILSSDPEAALLWGATISDEKTRSNVLERYARHWLGDDPVAAKQWIAKSAFPGELKARLLNENKK
jgi:hypothetical protein